MKLPILSDLDISGKRLLIRQDLNVPMNDGRVTSDARIRAALPTLQYALAHGAQVMVMSHLGRPKEGVALQDQTEVSLAPVAKVLEQLLGQSVPLVDHYLDGLPVTDAAIVLLENIRMNVGEKANDAALSKQLAGLCDIFVMDAFGTAHRAQASTVGVAQYAPAVCVGPLLAAELSALSKALAEPKSPVVAIVGGSKVSTKLEVLEALSQKVDTLIVGGGIANTFIAASGHGVGRSLYEPALVDAAKRISARVHVPQVIDVVVSDRLDASAQAVVKAVDAVLDEDMILDLGPQTMAAVLPMIQGAATIIWNGPLGVFEFEAFAGGTRALTEAIAASTAFSLAGGGDTLAAIDTFGVTESISYISTGGGAFLEFVEGKTLPAIAALEARVAQDQLINRQSKQE